MMYYKAIFELFQKLHQQIYAITYSNSICPFESGKFGKEGKKLQNFENLEDEKSFLNKIKNISHSF